MKDEVLHKYSKLSDDIKKLAENLKQLESLAECFRELNKELASSTAPAACGLIEYERKLRRREYIEMIHSVPERRDIRRYFPCDHAASGVMIVKKGRFVRRKK